MTTTHTERAVVLDVVAPVATLTLANARRRNPLSLATMRALTAVLREVGARDDVRVIVIRAEGPAFSAGHDLSELVDRTLDEEREVFAACTEMMLAVHEVPQPVIASVQGIAVAAGCQLVATCDLAVAAEEAGLDGERPHGEVHADDGDDGQDEIGPEEVSGVGEPRGERAGEERGRE